MPLLKIIRSFAAEVWKEFQDCQLLTVASSLAYTTLLSIVPLMAVSFAIFQAFGGLERLYVVLEPFLLKNLTQGSGELAADHVRQFVSNTRAHAVGATGFFALLFTSMSLLFSIDKAINRIWRATETRGLFQRLAAYWFFITLGPMGLSVALGMVTSKELPLSRILPGKSGLMAVCLILFCWVFKFVPNRKVHWRPAIVASSVTAIIWTIATILYGFYTSQLVRYDKIYGSLGAIPILLLWIYLNWVILLTGVAATDVLQRKYDFK
jgi:membrane protein